MDNMEEAEPAILVRGACKQYGKKSHMVLNSLDMTVRKGTIYGLLGASGCGKTTLLGAIIGSRKIQSGMISVLGKPPGMAAVKTIGYMPQDIALVGEFTIKGALQHFGWIFGMTDEQIDAKHRFLEELLDLPSAEKYIKNLSGGQQRRVSMAVVLVHDPDVLILDEPTVGLDPVLRQNIWDYLVKITEEEKKTIIITTHYIEEARQAHSIGLMRNGKILAEGEPRQLLDKYQCSTVENVFLLLSRKQKEGILSVSYDSRSSSICNDNLDDYQIIRSKIPKKTLWEKTCFTNRGHAKALITKNFLRLIRHPGGLLFAFILPLLQVSLFFLTVGVVPSDTKIGVVNEELENYTSCEEYKMHVQNPVGVIPKDNFTCDYHALGCKFVDHLGEKLRNTVYYKSKEAAMADVRKGIIHQFIYFPYNYTAAISLLRNREPFDDSDLDLQQVSIYRDVLDFTISTVTERELFKTFKNFAEDLARGCGTTIHAEKPPIAFMEPIYGTEGLTYTDFMAPGMLTIVSVFLSLSISSLTVITERTEGVWERTLVAGVSTTEILIFHTLTLCCISIFQLIETCIIAFYVFQLVCHGQLFVVFLLIYMQAIAGISFGVLISVACGTVTHAIYVALGIFYPYIILTGCVWPIEGMPTLMRYFSYLTPATLSVESVGHVIHKGWGLMNIHVFKGFLSSIGFICALSLFSILILKFEKK